MSCEIRSKNGKLLGVLSDSLDGEDYVIIDNKKVPLSEVQSNDKLKKAFNDSIKNDVIEDDDND